MAKNKSLKIFLLLIIFSVIILQGYCTENKNLSLVLLSNKNIYSIGENINMTIAINNSYNIPINGQLKGKVIVGNIGYEVQCFEFVAPQNKTSYLGLPVVPATLSTSPTKTMTTLYACSNTNMQSTKTITDNSGTSQNGQENYILGPFTFEYTYNNTDYESKSNTLNITVVSTQNQNQNQNSQEQQSSNNNQNQENTQQQANQEQSSQSNGQQQQSQSQNTPNSQNQSTLSSQQQKALSNNQQNAQTVNQLKQQINEAKANPLDTSVKTQKKETIWLVLLMLLIILILTVVYLKYYKKNDENLEEIKEEKPENTTPLYIELLEKIAQEKDKKEQVKLLSQSLREYIKSQNNITEDLTNNKAIKLTQDKLFKDILTKSEKIEFAKSSTNIDVQNVVKKLKNIYDGTREVNK